MDSTPIGANVWSWFTKPYHCINQNNCLGLLIESDVSFLPVYFLKKMASSNHTHKHNLTTFVCVCGVGVVVGHQRTGDPNVAWSPLLGIRTTIAEMAIEKEIT